ncbi:MAG: hypothetical protein J7K61_01660 [Thermoplasmata archaeon]|nr:hypothetical protein [Thermoplasmata archaeon]
MKAKIFSIAVLMLLLAGCVNPVEKEKTDNSFQLLKFKAGDNVRYHVYGKMTEKTDNGFLIYTSRGTASISVIAGYADDGFGNIHPSLEFHMNIEETPENHTSSGVVKGLPINVEKHIYRIADGDKIGGIIKSETVLHSFNRDRDITIYSLPEMDIIDMFYGKIYTMQSNGTFIFNNVSFKWKAAGIEHNAIKIDIHSDSIPNKNFSVWVKNGYSFPYKIEYMERDGDRENRYSFEMYKFSRGNGEEYDFSDIPLNYSRRGDYETWKIYRALPDGDGDALKTKLKDAFGRAQILSDGTANYSSLNDFMNKHENSYVIYASYWENENESGWEMYVGKDGLKEVYVMNATSNSKKDERIDITPYLPYLNIIPFPLSSLPDEMLTISSAADIFGGIENFDFMHYSFQISYVEKYYPDTIFDIWEGNSKDKEISIEKPYERGACLIGGLSKVVKNWSFGYRLIKMEQPPYIEFEGKIDGSNGMILYIARET